MASLSTTTTAAKSHSHSDKENDETYVDVVVMSKDLNQVQAKAKSSLCKYTEVEKIHKMSNTFKLEETPDISSRMKKSVGRSRGDLVTKTKETLKMNFSRISFDNYDSSNTAESVFKEEPEDCQKHSSILDEGYCESEDRISHSSIEIGDLARIMSKSEQYSSNSKMNSVSLLKRSSTPLARGRLDVSGSSGYFSGGTSFFNSPMEFQDSSPSSCKSDNGQSLFATSVVKTSNNATDLSQPSSASPVTCLTSNMKSVNLFQSPLTDTEESNMPINSRLLHVKSPFPPHSPLLSEADVQRHIMHQHLLKRTGTTVEQDKRPLCSLASLSKPDAGTGSSPVHDQHQSYSVLSNTHASSSKPLNRVFTPSMHFHAHHQQERSIPAYNPGDVVIHFDVRNRLRNECLGSAKRSVEISEDSQDAVSSSQESLRSEQDDLDTSLTNIHWLRGVQGIHELRQETTSKSAPPSENRPRESTSTNPVQWRYLSSKDVQQIAEECGTQKRPPFSYMTLIQMALHSRDDKRMTLKEICHWIEETFPFYQKTAKPGWKNSIRHNLSLYSIFEREKTKKHGSYWTVREDCPEKAKVQPHRDTRKDDNPNVQTVVPIPLNLANAILPTTGLPQSTMGLNGKKGPPPILPRPVPFSPTMQSYALIPIQSLNQQVSTFPIATNGSDSAAATPNLSENAGPANSEDPLKSCHILRSRYSNIAPKKSSSTASASSSSSSGASGVNLVRQAWLDSQTGTESESEKTSDICSPVAVTSLNNGNKKFKLKNGLPQPVFYERKTPPSRKTKGRRKQKLIPKAKELMNYSSDEDTAKFIAELEEDIEGTKTTDNSTMSTSSDNLTSTPFKQVGLPSPNLMSPIQTLTPLRTSTFLDGSFLECLKDYEGTGKEMLSPDVLCSKRLSMGGPPTSANQAAGSLMTPPRFIPDMGLVTDQNQSLSKLFVDMDDAADDFPVDLGDLSWSGLEQDSSFIQISLPALNKKESPS